MSAKDLYIQNITVSEYDSFQVKFPKVFTSYSLGAVRVDDQRFIDWDHYKFTLWQMQLDFVVKINLNEEKDKPDIKPKGEEIVKTKPDINSNKEHKQDVKLIRTKPNIEPNKEHKQDIKMMKTEPDMNKSTYEEEKVALVLGITSIFTVWWIFK